MHELLFRGKRMDNGQWVEAASILRTVDGAEPEVYVAAKGGVDVRTDDDGNINSLSAGNRAAWYRVEPDTLGQFTGLTDKNGRKIFEGDITRVDNGKQSAVVIVKYGDYLPEMFYKMLDMYVPGKQHLLAHGFYAVSIGKGEEMILFQSPCAEVFGNIHDNPELLDQ